VADRPADPDRTAAVVLTIDTVPLVDLGAQHDAIRSEIRGAMSAVIDSGRFILGETVADFERAAAEYFGTRFAIGVGSGLDALKLSLMAIGVGPGDEVILPANTFIATALAVSSIGARPVLVDCDGDTLTIDVSRIPGAITRHTRAIIPVHLYGQAAPMDAVQRVASQHGLQVIEDAAQAHGARAAGRRCGSIGDAGCFSFYPSKNLGALGDGGLVVTADEGIDERVRALRHYGQRTAGEHELRGGNSRLDAIQAAVLGVKLRHLERWNGERVKHAARYRERLAGAPVTIPGGVPDSTHVYHLFVVRSADRDRLRAHLAALGVQTGVHYARPVHLTGAYRDLGYGVGAFPQAERAAREVLSLPMYPELIDRQIDRVVDGITRFPI
jgi:dTDP-4-amino-4,6-dideoxygalactose transaminase